MFSSCLPKSKSATSVIESPPNFRPDRRILAPQHIRKLIDENYALTSNFFDFVTVSGITAVLQRKYSDKITTDMVLKAIYLEPAYKVNYHCDTAGCRFVKRIHI
jgi:hypothetical protein